MPTQYIDIRYLMNFKKYETIGVMAGASEDSQGSIGLVPAPPAKS